MLTDFWVWSEICCRKIREGALRPILFFKKENNNSVLIAWLSGNKKTTKDQRYTEFTCFSGDLNVLKRIRCTVVHSVRYCEIQSPWKLYNDNKKNKKTNVVAAFKKTKWFNNYGTKWPWNVTTNFYNSQAKKKMLPKYRQMFQQLKWIDKLWYAHDSP